MSKKKEIKTNAMRLLDTMKIPYEQHTYECKEFKDGLQIADTMGQPYEKVFKTLVAVGSSKDYYVFVIPIAKELDLKKAARIVGEKSMDMLPVKEINRVTGYIRGGCTSIGMKKQYVTRIDDSAAPQTTIIVSGGSLGSQIELAPDDLVRATGAEYADLVKQDAS
ncbi:MAG: Cys-tRNA(Pro) deacylase [Lachnospiraceae bacterium]|nr:Cys-tRNA(Pro) deacylase [Lachnospiraceae bacterium]